MVIRITTATLIIGVACLASLGCRSQGNTYPATNCGGTPAAVYSQPPAVPQYTTPTTITPAYSGSQTTQTAPVMPAR